jgi:long-chain acyl-CoA synthetase
LMRGESIALSGPDTPPNEGVWLGVCSSGTTGRPKLVWREWADLLRETTRPPAVGGWIWSSPFMPATYAGVRVALQAWTGGGRVISLNMDWARAAETMRRTRPQALCCTPTYIDLLLQNCPGRIEGLRQITLGGEPLRPALGLRLAARFPATRFTIVYATAELGPLMKTHRLDGWYETASLHHSYKAWRIINGQLQVHGRRGWLDTRDHVERDGNFLRVVGRADAVANVAGTKVSLAEVARLAEEITGVRRALALAEPNPVTGQIVCLRYAIEPEADRQAVEQDLKKRLRRRLRKEAWPRRWEEDEVGPVANGKRGWKIGDRR